MDSGLIYDLFIILLYVGGLGIFTGIISLGEDNQHKINQYKALYPKSFKAMIVLFVILIVFRLIDLGS